jgi:predicted PurR-regulated permease PerM
MSRERSWWKAILLAIGAAVAAAIAWGAFEPKEEEEPEAALPGTPGTDVVAVVEVPAALSASQPEGRRLHDPAKEGPSWVRPTIRWTVLWVLAIIVAILLLEAVRQVVVYILLALFFSFALEPAVNYLHARRGWRRGSATGLLLALMFLGLVVIVVIFVSAIVQGAQLIVAQFPTWVDSFAEWVFDVFGYEIQTGAATESSEAATESLQTAGADPILALFGFTVGLLGGIFAVFTVGMFIFYMVADAPRFKRAVLSMFPRPKQEELVSIWEAAIEKTGGYFYSRLLLAVINGTLSFVVLVILGAPGAAALAVFQGAVAAFIPIIGTYISSAVPIVVLFASEGAKPALIYLVYVLIYQQVENYLLSPRIQGKTMQLHPAVAFGAALAGGALGGLMWAFLALPFAATVQASATLWVERHEVVETDFTREPAPLPERDQPERTVGRRVGGWLRKRRGWIRRSVDEAVEEATEPVVAEVESLPNEAAP